MDQLPFKWFVDFIAQTAYPCLNDVGLRIEIVFPYMFHDHGLGNDAPGIAYQIFQKLKLQRLNVDSDISACDPVAQEIDCQIRHCERCRIGSRVCPSQKCLNACEKLGKGERFCQIIIASELKSAYFIFNGILCTENDNRSRNFCRTDFSITEKPSITGSMISMTARSNSSVFALKSPVCRLRHEPW